MTDRETLLNAFAHAACETWPYPHWLLADVLTPQTLDAILALPTAAPAIEAFDGTREANNKTRHYFNPETCARFPVCRSLVEAFKDPATIERLEETCGIDLSQGQLRIEYTQDTSGFWLEPHTDISVKLFTMLIYLSKEPALADAGTDIFDRDLRHVKTAPFKSNHGMIFIPGQDTWHGFIKRPIRGVRRSLIVNYVSPAWRDRYELA